MIGSIHKLSHLRVGISFVERFLIMNLNSLTNIGIFTFSIFTFDIFRKLSFQGHCPVL